MDRRAHTSRRVIAASVLAWLPILFFELLHPYPPARFLMSPILARGFLFASLVCLAVAVPMGLAGALLARFVGRRRGDAAAAASGMAAAILGSALFLQFYRLVQQWVALHWLPFDAGTAAAVALAALAAVTAVGLIVLLAPRRAALPVAAIVAAGVLAYWSRTVDGRFQVRESPIELTIAAPVAVALLVTLLAASVGQRLGKSSRLAAHLIVAGAIAVPLVVLASQADGVRRAVAATPRPPATGDVNVVVLLIDTLRADHMSSWGYDKPTTPAIERLLADRTTDFVHAAAAGTSTIPSVKSFFASLPPSHEGEGMGNYPPYPGRWTIARAFRESGYATAGLSANGLVDGDGFTEGFDEFAAFGGHKYFQDSFLLNDLLCGDNYWRSFRRMAELRLHEETAPHVRRIYRRWLEQSAHRPFFLYVHFVDPHWPYYDRDFGLVPPELKDLPHPLSYVDLLQLKLGKHANAAYRGTRELRELVARYDSEIRFVDEVIGGMFDDLHSLGLDDSTLVVILADHGEEFFEHDGFSHGHDVYEEQVHVPLLVRWPKRPEFAGMPGKIETPASLLDVLPTLTDYLRLAPPPNPLFGRSLRPLLEGTAQSWPGVLSESHLPKVWRKGYREGDLKVRFTYSPSISFDETDDVQVFDLAADPGERRPLPKKDPRVAAFVGRTRADIKRRLRETSAAP